MHSLDGLDVVRLSGVTPCRFRVFTSGNPLADLAIIRQGFVCLCQPLSGTRRANRIATLDGKSHAEVGFPAGRHGRKRCRKLSRLACARALAAGIEVAPLMAKAGVTSWQVEDDDVWLTVKGQIKFLDLIADALQDDFLGFHLARDFDLREIGLLYFVAASSEELDDALQRAARYTATVNEAVSLTYRERNDVAISFGYLGVARHSDRHQIEFWIATLVRISRELTGRVVLPHRVQLTHRRHEELPEFNAFLGCDVEFGAAVDEVAFPRSIKDLRWSAGSLPQQAVDRLLRRGARAARDAGWWRPCDQRSRTRSPRCCRTGRRDLAEIARKLGLSQRSLARRLASEGLTFGRLFDELRFDLAQRHLKDFGLVDLADRVASRLPGSQRFYPRIQTVERQDAKGGTLARECCAAECHACHEMTVAKRTLVPVKIPSMV